MADASSSSAMGPVPSKGRALAFGRAGLPSTVELKLAAFVTGDGVRVEETTIRVVTTPRRKANVTMEATAQNFEWLVKAAHEDWAPSAPPPKKQRADEDDADLPALSWPCKYAWSAAGKIKIVCSYRDQSTWKRMQRAVEPSMVGCSFAEGVRKCEQDVLEVYEANHNPIAEPHAAEAEAPPPAGEAKQGEEQAEQELVGAA